MSLIIILSILIIGALLAWASDRINNSLPRWISIASLLLAIAALLILVPVPDINNSVMGLALSNQWWMEYSVPWIARFGINFQLGIDGLSYLMLILTLLLSLFGVSCSWSEINNRVGFFHFNFLCTVAGIVGVFTALDLFLFFFFWEVMLLPMVMLIGIWGHENRVYAAIKFFIFTQASSLLMLISMIVLVLWNFEATGVLTFNYFDLLDAPLGETQGFWLMLGFFIAFAVKMPVVLGHTWLPDAHTQAPTAGSVILAAILLKTGAYGLIRFALPLFPEASVSFAPIAMLLAVVGILYGAKLAFAQQDIKRFIAYTSISHMGFVLLGIYAMNTIAMQGAVVQMVAHGLSTAGLFMIAGMLQERLHSRNLDLMGGLWTSAPKLGAFALFFSVASLGMPGLANFVAEFLILVGSFNQHPIFTMVAALGLIAAAIYSLAMLQRAFWGEARESSKGMVDLNNREVISMLLLAIALIFFGLRPQPLINIAEQSVDAVIAQVVNIEQPPVSISADSSNNLKELNR
jgi:NADH-quinone oxidoreductase subunit M